MTSHYDSVCVWQRYHINRLTQCRLLMMIQIECKICKSPVNLSEGKGKCATCGMFYSPNEKGILSAQDCDVSCPCGCVTKVAGTPSTCRACWNTLKWDNQQRQWTSKKPLRDRIFIIGLLLGIVALIAGLTGIGIGCIILAFSILTASDL